VRFVFAMFLRFRIGSASLCQYQWKNYFYLGSRNACGRFSTPFVMKENSISGVCGQKKPHFGQNRHISVQQWQMFVKQLSISYPCNARSFCL